MKRISLSFKKLKIDDAGTSKATIIIWIALICSVLGIVSKSVIFIPIGFLFSLVAIFTGQVFWGVFSFFLSLFGLFVSPLLWMSIGKIVLFLYVNWGQILEKFLDFASSEGLDI